MLKFKKDREVDSGWLNVPEKYMSEVDGSDTMSKGKYAITEETIKETYNDYLEVCKRLGETDIITLEEFKEDCSSCRKWVEPKHDKTFCIVELYKTHAVCGWRNNKTCKIGRTFTCAIEKHNNHPCLKYKDKYYRLDTPYGWVY